MLVVGCGNSRTPLQALPAAPGGFRPLLRVRPHGVQLQIPDTWPVLGAHAPLLAVIASGPAVIAVWRFPRAAPAPVGAAALGRALARLVSAARRRDSTLHMINSAIVTINGAQAIELDAIERIAGQIRRVRSTHVFARGREIVLDEYAPVDQFPELDHQVFSPVKRSLLVSPL